MTSAEPSDLWIFAYGSLMWRPDFSFVECQRGRIFGFHRALCIYSHHYRGTVDQPGLVLGLDRGGSCVGLCFRIAAEGAAATLASVRRRELVTDVYEEIAAPVRLGDGRRTLAVTYAARRTHAQYAADLPIEDVVRLVRQGVGVSGTDLDYVRSTHAHLLELGIVDPSLARLGDLGPSDPPSEDRRGDRVNPQRS